MLICTKRKAGCTHLQHALVCTFGYNCAVYLSGLARHAERLAEMGRRCLLVQIGGAAGTLASLGNDNASLRVRAQLAVELVYMIHQSLGMSYKIT